MPVDLLAGMVALRHHIEWDYLAQFTRDELEQVFLIPVRSNRFGQTDERFVLRSQRPCRTPYFQPFCGYEHYGFTCNYRTNSQP
jgi:hypothetical protein